MKKDNRQSVWDQYKPVKAVYENGKIKVASSDEGKTNTETNSHPLVSKAL